MSVCRVLVLISGNGSNLQAIMDQALPKAPYQVVGVISNKADAYGLVRARAAGIASHYVMVNPEESRADYDLRLSEAIEQLQPDLIVLAGFMRILSDELVKAYQGRMINIHPSLLPKFTGLHTHQRAIEAGEQEHGASVHFVTPTLDAGPVILQAKVPVFDDDTVELLAERVHEQEHAILPLVVKWFAEGRLKMLDGKAWLDNQPLGAAGYAAD
ncbi:MULTISPECIES: phosphoribosylglycinamide formyltransferase [Shewanella]|jgi:phosphoribosylglycinamide formyltransferase-1|uniref:Phosphoribosylglycinamide formyltransferase n=1 Tax=Shewanella fodinae TaxID=552357 RepID=A0A4R2F8F9_9GAMM|nr:MULTISPECIES: phosphoribosylglycinamide formyltransferase [Shewanella]MDN5369689.1 phosphoribosylglycinamide formyltransferase 1 [Shewanella sp.]MBO1271407.1 phosphoribosylglycinamide formyltransferase [Shewanella sp. 4t3-1-2LB]MCL2905350.1 phosphoribosylglycinamide formyltransferase [Shewanella fodinae]TCN83630.1 formyltetrahydrofolate-dependent phosphoribosylglycinamide formyltransferase [Shewanella fodinae]GGY90353.1 phosphoribosylglycinamide formyltransferase [Shewanella fodinae]